LNEKQLDRDRKEEFVKKNLIDALNNVSRNYLDSIGREYSACSWLFFSIMLAIIINYLSNPSMENLWVLALAVILVILGYWHITRNFRHLVSKISIENMMNVWAIAESKGLPQHRLAIKLISLDKEPLILFGSIKLNIKYLPPIVIILIFVIYVEYYIEQMLYAMFRNILIIGLIRLFFLGVILLIFYVILRYVIHRNHV